MILAVAPDPLGCEFSPSRFADPRLDLAAAVEYYGAVVDWLCELDLPVAARVEIDLCLVQFGFCSIGSVLGPLIS
jgi:hypothetical protein